jgi:hypothetical protein
LKTPCFEHRLFIWQQYAMMSPNEIKDDQEEQGQPEVEDEPKGK